MYPCSDHPALTDELDAKNLSWRYYTPSANSIWTGPNAIEHICGPNAPPPNGTACMGSDWVNNVVIYSAKKSGARPHRHCQQSASCGELGDTGWPEFGSPG